MSTEYASLKNDSRPEFIGGFFSIDDEKQDKRYKNKFLTVNA